MLRRALLLLGWLALCTAPVAAQQIGVVASAEPTMRGTAPGGASRTLSIGDPIAANEIISTDANGRGQILFRDQSTLALGPNTTVVLDEFVFDPSTGDGQLSLELTEGVLRFIGGTLSERTPATVALPGATIGIRGSTGLIFVIDGEPFAVFLSGDQMCVDGGSGRACTSRIGGVLTPTGYAGPSNSAFLSTLLALVDSSIALEAITPQAINNIANEVVPGVGTVARQEENSVIVDLDGFLLDFTADDLLNALTDPDTSNTGTGGGGTGGGGTGGGGISCPPGYVLVGVWCFLIST